MRTAADCDRHAAGRQQRSGHAKEDDAEQRDRYAGEHRLRARGDLLAVHDAGCRAGQLHAGGVVNQGEVDRHRKARARERERHRRDPRRQPPGSGHAGRCLAAATTPDEAAHACRLAVRLLAQRGRDVVGRAQDRLGDRARRIAHRGGDLLHRQPGQDRRVVGHGVDDVAAAESRRTGCSWDRISPTAAARARSASRAAHRSCPAAGSSSARPCRATDTGSCTSRRGTRRSPCSGRRRCSTSASRPGCGMCRTARGLRPAPTARRRTAGSTRRRRTRSAAFRPCAGSSR